MATFTRRASLGVIMVLAAAAGGCRTFEKAGWQAELAKQLPALGHRNWILIADSAYPAQSRPAISTIVTEADHLEVVEAVLKAVDGAPHVRGNFYLDAELEYLTEKNAPGIDTYRRQLFALLDNHPIKKIPHEQLIARLDEAAKMFRVLVLKTNLTLPYTSVFIELDCGYWDQARQQQLREAMSAGHR